MKSTVIILLTALVMISFDQAIVATLYSGHAEEPSQSEACAMAESDAKSKISQTETFSRVEQAA